MATTETPPAPTSPAPRRRSTPAADTDNGARSTTRTREYVVVEDAGDGKLSVHSTVEAPNPDEACWKLVEEPGSELNTRAKGDSPPRLLGIAKSGFDFEPFKLAEEKVTKRVKS